MKHFLIFTFILLNILFFSCHTSTNKNVTNLSPEELKQILINNDSIQLVDVRKPTEYVAGHIPKAISINYFSNDFAKSIGKLNNKKPVYIYCRSGKRSGKSVIEFKKAGFTKIYNLKGGILNWQSKGFDIQIK
ncbi:rhodanese-like domain-containing protein [uncultured Algibacter sp.]|uniref:rhodanese-like domain-containing protein n=1 Tax=uncultured Algibacter sp. TaxID=298659 RepID=UPI002635D29E|nr:rhodanese-like domain-containing protein [uncultured Algibacter sp.]